MSKKQKKRFTKEGIFHFPEPENGDDDYTPQERDALYNEFLSYHCMSDEVVLRVAKSLKRTHKSMHRQWEVILYSNEAKTKVFTYEPHPTRISRRGLKWSGNDRRILNQHWKDGVDPKRTAIILARDLDEVQRYFNGLDDLVKSKAVRNKSNNLGVIEEKEEHQ